MADIVISQIELQELSGRRNILQSKQVELNLLTREYSLYQADVLKKYGLDENKQYNIDARGVVTEKKQYIEKPVEVKEDKK